MRKMIEKKEKQESKKEQSSQKPSLGIKEVLTEDQSVAEQSSSEETPLLSQSPARDNAEAFIKEFKQVENENSGEIYATEKEKLDNWGSNKPSDELYLKHRTVFNNPEYYEQDTGKTIWPKDEGFAGARTQEVLQPGFKIDRYGLDFGKFVSPEGIPYGQRAVAPGTDLKPYSVFEVLSSLEVLGGKIAPWFDEVGGGIQYILPDSVANLLAANQLRRV